MQRLTGYAIGDQEKILGEGWDHRNPPPPYLASYRRLVLYYSPSQHCFYTAVLCALPLLLLPLQGPESAPGDSVTSLHGCSVWSNKLYNQSVV